MSTRRAGHIVHVTALKAVGIVGIAALIAGGFAEVAAPQASALTRDVMLTAGPDLSDSTTALIMGPGGWPDPNETYMAAVDRMYLASNGFTGETVAAPYSWLHMFDGWDDRVAAETNSLVETIQEQLDNGGYGADNPLVIVGYSESAVAAGQAMQQLHDDGIPSDALHFILLGDTASADGGFLSSLMPSLPEWLREPIENLLAWSGLSHLLGATTPTNLYTTDVYTINGDPWSDWPTNLAAEQSTFSTALTGMFSTHLEYLGLTPDQIGDAILTNPAELTDSLTNYWTIPDTGINFLETLWNAAVSMGDVPTWLLDLVG